MGVHNLRPAFLPSLLRSLPQLAITPLIHFEVVLVLLGYLNVAGKQFRQVGPSAGVGWEAEGLATI